MAFTLNDAFLIAINIGAIVIMLWTTYYRARVATLILFILTVLVDAYCIPNMLQMIQNDPWKFVIGIALYCLLGIIWSVLRWVIHLNTQEVKDLISSAYSRYTSQPTATRENVSFKNSIYYPFSFSKDSALIISWAAFWPVSVVWTFLRHFIVNMGHWLWNVLEWVGHQFASVFAAIADRAVNKIIKK